MDNNSPHNTNQSYNLLHDALKDFVSQMSDAFFQLIVVDNSNTIKFSFNNNQFPDLQLKTDDNWELLNKKITWNSDAGLNQGILFNNNLAYNIIEYNTSIDNINLNIYLISSIDIDFPWLKMAITGIDTAIKSRFKNKTMQKEIDDTLQYTFAIMNALKIGVIAVNETGKILFANNLACRWINIRRRELLLIPIKKLITNWISIQRIVSSGEKYVNEEIVVKSQEQKSKYNATVSPILDQSQTKLIGLVIALRELENVYNLVHKYTGMQARFSFDDIITDSDEMHQLIEYSMNIADSPSTVLIEAESGTGKEVFAQSIHNASSRKDQGFVAINCAAISENLIESELFGYDDGAFTGAKKGGHPGKFELANGGTLFLDEIGDMKPELQVKLLRAIQEGSITRVGGTKNIPVDVRIIAATNKNLKAEVDKGNFRLDLYYRLSVIPLKIPPLKDRKKDIPLLIDYFLNKKAIRLQKFAPSLPSTILNQFINYGWPGNIRELENAIEQYVNLDGNISFENLKLDSTQTKNTTNKTITNQEVQIKSISDMEKELIEQTLAFHKNNITSTAKSLRISRNTLYLKLKKHNIII